MKHMHILSFLCIFLPAYISADIIKLIDGQTAECKIIDTTGNKIVIDRGGKISKINKKFVVSYQIGDDLEVGKKETKNNNEVKRKSIINNKLLSQISNFKVERGRMRLGARLNICDCVFVGEINPVMLLDCFEILKEKLSKSLKIRIINPNHCTELLESNSDSISYLLVLKEINTKREEGARHWGGGFNTVTGTFNPGFTQDVYIFKSTLHATVIDLKSKTIIFDKLIKESSDETKERIFKDDEQKGKRYIKAQDRAKISLFNTLAEKIFFKIEYIPDNKNIRRR